MENVIENFKIKDIALLIGAEEIQLAEAEMPGLISLREEFESPSRFGVHELRDVCT